MILTVSGWRNWTDPEAVHMHLERYLHLYGAKLHLRVGDASGVDEFTRDWMFDKTDNQGARFTYQVYRADWVKFGKPAGPKRNGQMLRGENSSDLQRGIVAGRLLAFPQPGINWKTDKSGTVDCILQAVELGVHLDVPGYKI